LAALVATAGCDAAPFSPELAAQFEQDRMASRPHDIAGSHGGTRALAALARDDRRSDWLAGAALAVEMIDHDLGRPSGREQTLASLGKSVAR